MDATDWLPDYNEDSPELSESLRRVFARLPDCVRADLSTVVQEVTASSQRDTALELQGQGACTVAVDDSRPDLIRYSIYVSRSLPNTASRDYIIVHELAHAYLRHPTLLLQLNQVRQYPVSEEHLRQIIEDQADSHVIMWGFRDELLDFHKSFPDARRPSFLPYIQ